MNVLAKNGIEVRKFSSAWVKSMARISKCLLSMGLISFFLISSYFLRHAAHSILRWIENQSDVFVVVTLIVLYTIVSLPFAWGYIVINIATGYKYGVLAGTLISVFTATVGIFFAHLIVKNYMTKYIKMWLTQSFSNSGTYLRLIDVLLTSPNHSFKIITLSRLTPVPFGLQNYVFAMSTLPTFKYLQATVIGLLPCQILNAYLGSKLRSIEEVLVDSPSATIAFVALTFQILVAIILVIIAVMKAREELHNILGPYQIFKTDVGEVV